MTITIELSPEMERRLEEEASRIGQAPPEFARSVLEERLAAPAQAQMERNRRAIAVLRQWSEEDAANPEPGPVPVIPPLSLRVPDVG